MDKILRLYPLPSEELPLTGAYLKQDLRQYAPKTGMPFVYANFVVSLDGRIAVPRTDGTGLMIPKTIANERDWRLYQELAAQADLLISSGRYLRDWAEGRAQEILQVDDPRFVDLRQWRVSRSLPPQADIAVISGSLIFPIPPVITAGGRRLIVITTENADPQRAREIEAQGGQVITAGKMEIDGRLMLERLKELGYLTIYSGAGPRILHLLVTGGALNRLYLTYANRILGGDPFAAVSEGPLLESPIGMKVNQIYLDPHALDGLGQLFVSYDRA